MDLPPLRHTVRTGPEAKILQELKLYLKRHGWYIKKLHGGKYQSGLPDLVAFHPVHGQRWIETKAPGEKLRVSQIYEFEQMDKYGAEVYVLTSYTQYDKLFGPGNWRRYI